MMNESFLQPKFKDDMAVVVTELDFFHELAINQTVNLTWTIKNNQSKPWPCNPFLLNLTTGEKTKVNFILEPDQEN